MQVAVAHARAHARVHAVVHVLLFQKKSKIFEGRPGGTPGLYLQ